MITEGQRIARRRARWVEALRSGAYVQERGSLKTVNLEGRAPCHCAIGVLCEVFEPEGWEDLAFDELGRMAGALPGATRFRVFRRDDTGTPGMRPDDALAQSVAMTEAEAREVVSLNDTIKASFDQIADFLEGKRTYEDLSDRRRQKLERSIRSMAAA